MSAPLSLRFARVSFSFESRSTPLFQDVEFQLERGWTGVVGENGAGKTTLLQLITGALRPSSGQVQRVPDTSRVVFCEQQLDAPTPALRAFAEDPEPLGWTWLGRLDLDPSMVDRWAQLSPGERKRFQLAQALASEPDVLLVDEPTNHLDVAGREKVVEALKRFHGIGLVVTHDRELLAELTTQTLRVDRGGVRLWPVSYDAAKDAWEGEDAHRLSQRQAQKAQVEKLHRQLVTKREERQAADAQRSTGKRMKNKHDSDARTLMANFTVEQAEKSLGREVGVVRREHAKAQEALDGMQMTKTLGRSIQLEHERAERPILLHLENDSRTLEDGRTLWKDQTLTVDRNARIWLRGPNGAGKSTLLRRFLEASTLPPERFLSLPQELSREEGADVLAEVMELPPDERGRLLTRVAALGLDPDVLKESRQPSPGEVRKLLLAKGLDEKVWLLVLDEPTNHLDLPSVERLEAALQAFPGAVLLVSHDARFAQSVATETWTLEAGALTT